MIERINEALLPSVKEYRDLLREYNPEFKGASNLVDYDDIDRWYLNAKLFESEDSCPPGYTLSYQYGYVLSGKDIIGLINIRPKAHLYPYLMNYVGHIGYSVKPGYRNAHIGTYMLESFLPIVKKEFGLDRVLITCDKNNIGSKKIILANNGILENTLYCSYENCDIERYWIDIK